MVAVVGRVTCCCCCSIVVEVVSVVVLLLLSLWLLILLLMLVVVDSADGIFLPNGAYFFDVIVDLDFAGEMKI